MFNLRVRRLGALLLAGSAAAALTVALPTSATAATPGVGDVSDAMRYDVAGPFGAPLAELSGEDDEVQTVAAPFPINFFGHASAGLCVTTNGGFYPVPSATDGCSDEYDKNVANLALESGAPMIAALAADADLGECPDAGFDGFALPCQIYFGTTSIEGRDAVVITWYRVPMYENENSVERSNTFQIVLIKGATGSDAAGWDFTIELNYGTLTDGEDGYSAIDPASDCQGIEGDLNCRWGIGWANYLPGPPASADPYELFAGSPVPELLNDGATPMVSNSLNSTVLGRYTWGMTGGVTTGFQVPTMGPPPAPAAEPEGPSLPATGSEIGVVPVGAALLLLIGAVLLSLRRGARA